jgi:uncharacterized protein YceK
MARSVGRAVLAVGIAVWLSGCGTAANTLWLLPMEGGMSAYGGVKADVEMVRGGVARAVDADSLDSFADAAYYTVVGAVDLPLSAVGDTLTLPVVLAAALKEADGDGDSDSP